MSRTILLLLGTLFSLGLNAASSGGELYQRHCAACHGLDGQGGVGVPLSLPGFLATASDHYLATTIREGRPGRVMPAFTDLDEGQITAIITHMRHWHPEYDPSTTEATVQVGSGDARRGATLYVAHCAQCHGTNGEGGKGTGVTFSRPRDLPIMAPALNNPGFLSAASDEMIKRTLMEGREGTPMIAFRQAGLSEQDIDDIVHFIRAMEANPIHWQYQADEAPDIVMPSEYDLATTVENVQRAASGKNFRIIRVQHLEDGLFGEGELNSRQVIIYFCNFKFINQALGIDPRAGLFMPCRITAIEAAEGSVTLHALNPKFMSRLFNNSELDEACDQMYDTYVTIMEEATL